MLAVFSGWRGLLGALGLAGAVILGKAALVVLVSLGLRMGLGTGIRAGLALAQIGEFSFVLLQIAHRQGLLGGEVFNVLVSSSVATLLLTPYLLRASGTMAGRLEKLAGRRSRLQAEASPAPAGHWKDHVVVVGFGPAGMEVSRELRVRNQTVVVLDVNPRTAASSAADLPVEYGDATQPEVLTHVGIADARAVVVTVPDPYTARLIISQVRRLAPRARIITRARYHTHQGLLQEAGSDRVVSEEVVIGRQLARDSLALLADGSIS
jgi:CPA2 family monovalent cation:H+ antiporter-2